MFRGMFVVTGSETDRTIDSRNVGAVCSYEWGIQYPKIEVSSG